MADPNGSKEADGNLFSDSGSSDVKIDGSLEFVHEYGGNQSKPSYQEASGAPVETISPLGLQVTWFTTIFLNIGQMIGTGVFSTREYQRLITPSIQMKKRLTISISCHYSQRCGVCWTQSYLLGSWIGYCWVSTCDIHGTCELFSK